MLIETTTAESSWINDVFKKCPLGVFHEADRCTRKRISVFSPVRIGRIVSNAAENVVIYFLMDKGYCATLGLAFSEYCSAEITPALKLLCAESTLALEVLLR